MSEQGPKNVCIFSSLPFCSTNVQEETNKKLLYQGLESISDVLLYHAMLKLNLSWLHDVHISLFFLSIYDTFGIKNVNAVKRCKFPGTYKNVILNIGQPLWKLPEAAHILFF